MPSPSFAVRFTHLADPISSLLLCMRLLVIPVGVGLLLSPSRSTSTMLPAQESTSSSPFSSTLQSSSSEVLDAAEELSVAEFLSADCPVTGDEILCPIWKRKSADIGFNPSGDLCPLRSPLPINGTDARRRYPSEVPPGIT